MKIQINLEISGYLDKTQDKCKTLHSSAKFSKFFLLKNELALDSHDKTRTPYLGGCKLKMLMDENFDKFQTCDWSAVEKLRLLWMK